MGRTVFRTKYNRIEFQGEMLSASEIARRHGVSAPTILRRYAQGLRDAELAAAPYSLPAAENGKAFSYRSDRMPTPLQARARLRKAQRGVELATARLMNAKALGETKRVIVRLDKLVFRAQARRMYCAEMVRMVDSLREDTETAA